MHFIHPVPQAVENDRANETVVRSDDVAGPGIIAAEATVLFEQVVRGVVDTSLRVSRTVVISLSGVVEHDVEDHFDTRFMKCGNEVVELVKLFSRHS